MISVIIPTRNRADLLGPALESLTRQNLSQDQFEVIVIDNGSTDSTAQVTQEFTKRITNLRYFYESEPGLHVGRHRGMIEANSDILVFADDDIEATPTWLEAIQEAFLNPLVAMVGGNNLPKFLHTPPQWLKKIWDQPQKNGSHSIPALSVFSMKGSVQDLNPYYVWGCNFSIRKHVLYHAGGFHPDGMPKNLIRFRGDGETHVSQYVKESGLRCIFHPGASVFHKVTPERMTFDYFYQRGFNQGVSDSFTTLRNSSSQSTNSTRSILKKILSRCQILTIWLSYFDTDVVHALKEMNRGHLDGFSYHQKAYQEDADVRSWVHKPNFFEEVVNG